MSFDIAKYSTKLCVHIGTTNCPFGNKCFYAHSTNQLRRNPEKYTYSSKLCPFFKSPNGKSYAKGRFNKEEREKLAESDLLNGCPFGKGCRFSHTLRERFYHPDVYKTLPCRTKNCEMGDMCSFDHDMMGDEEVHVSTLVAESILE